MDSKLLEKIRQLLALGNAHNNASNNEAEIALVKAKQLMEQHNISMSEVEVQQLKKKKAVDYTARTGKRRYYFSWHSRLFFICDELFTTAHYHQKIQGGDNVTVHFFGLPEDVALSCAVYEVLYKLCNRLARSQRSQDLRSYLAGKEEPLSTKDKNAYLDGLTTSLLFRARQMSDNLTREQQSKCTSITVIKSDAIKEMEEELNIGIKKTAVKDKSSNPLFDEGYQQGQEVDLNFKGGLKQGGD